MTIPEQGQRIAWQKILEDKVIAAHKLTDSLSPSVLAEYCEGASPHDIKLVLDNLKTKGGLEEKRNKVDYSSQTNFFFKLPAPNPESFQWWYTLESQETFASVISETLDISESKGLCIGTPTIASYLKSMGSDVTLMDIDKDVINVFCKVYGSDNSQDELALQYDVHHELPEKVSGRFDYVVIDPPWYQHYFEKFINRAISALNERGVIFCSVPKILTRPSIQNEREKLFTALNNSGHNILFLQKGGVKYIVPKFEEVALGHNDDGFQLKPWRSSDLLAINILGKKQISLGDNDSELGLSSTSIYSRDITKSVFRVFVSENVSNEVARNTIKPVTEYSNTISKREKCPPFNIWTSDKKAFLVKDVELAKIILNGWTEDISHKSIHTEIVEKGFATNIKFAKEVFDEYEESLELWQKYSEGNVRRTDKKIKKIVKKQLNKTLAQPPSNREHQNTDDGYRIEFQRDRDRVIWSSGFRKLSDKTQLFPLDEDDQLRQRLAHSIEVAQLASTIAASFGLDKDLVEAGALAHDIGHTPFGHAGEHALDVLLSKHLNVEAGFNHYEHGVDVVRYLEGSYLSRGGDSHAGLDLTPEVCDCILKHGYCHHKNAKETGIWDKSKHKKFINNSGYCHLEGQAVRAADKISYLLSDIEDGIKLGAVTYQDLISCKLFHRPPMDFRLREGESLYSKFLDQRGALIKVLMEDIILESSKRLSGISSLESVKKYGDYCIYHSPKINEDMAEIWNKIQTKKLHADPRVRAANLQASKMVSDLTLLYIAIPGLIEENFRIEHEKLLSHAKSRNYITHYEGENAEGKLGIKTVPVETSLFRFLPLDKVIGEGINVDLTQSTQRIRVYDIILAKDFVAGLTDKRTKSLYRSLLMT